MNEDTDVTNPGIQPNEPGEITALTKAAIKMADLADTMGVTSRLAKVLSDRCDRIPGNATDSPRPGERRNTKWRGQEKEDIEYSDHTSITKSGESSSLDQMGDEMWKRFLKSKKQKEQPKQPEKDCPGE